MVENLVSEEMDRLLLYINGFLNSNKEEELKQANVVLLINALLKRTYSLRFFSIILTACPGSP
jgi:hypothetical protein